MVLLHTNTHVFQNDFSSVTGAIFNRYPNPLAPHVVSIDTLSRKIDAQGNLLTTRLIKKQGRLPRWIEYVIGSRVTESWMIEYSIVDPKRLILRTYKKNLDHVRILQVEEYTTYSYDDRNKNTVVRSKVRFSGGGFSSSLRSKLEDWSKRRFDESVKKSRQGMQLVIQKIEENARKKAVKRGEA